MQTHVSFVFVWGRGGEGGRGRAGLYTYDIYEQYTVNYVTFVSVWFHLLLSLLASMSFRCRFGAVSCRAILRLYSPL